MNQQDYNKALSRAWELMDAEEGTPEAEELERLAEEIEEFEEVMPVLLYQPSLKGHKSGAASDR